jgi:tetratricopeptide (TPR) repeat protein
VEFIKRHPLVTGFGVIGIIMLAGVILARWNETADSLSERALRNFQRGFQRQAESDIARALAIDPDDERTLVIAATIAMQGSELEKARELYARIETPRLLDQHMLLADASIMAREMEMAEMAIEAIRARREDHPMARDSLLRLYRMTNRSWEHRTQVLDLLREQELSRPDVEFLFGLANPYNASESEFRDSARDLTNPDPIVRLTACINYIKHQEPETARPALQRLIEERPGLIEARARLGFVLAHAEDYEALREWFVEQPPEAFAHPEVCFASGVAFENAGEREYAIQFYRKALSIDYRHQASLQRIIGLQDPDAPAVQKLKELDAAETELATKLVEQSFSLNPETLEVNWGLEVLDLVLKLGWLPEAKAWCSLFRGDDAARFVIPLREIENRLEEADAAPEDAERDWPAIEPVFRELELPGPPSEEWILERQAAWRNE